MSGFIGETYSEFFRRSLGAWTARNLPAWQAPERLTADIAQPLTEARIKRWFDDLLRSISTPALEPGATDQPVEAPSSAVVGQTLRRVRNWLMLCLIERDLRGLASLAEVCEAMTLFAQFSAQQALVALAREHRAQYGLPCDEQGQAQDLLIIAMGKAGGGELNVSSDLDVVFVVRDSGETRPDPGSSSAPTVSGLSSGEFFHRLARQWVALMSNNDEFGFVFRIDTRLRPEGDSGPLVVTLPMLEHYFFGQAREWERFAWLKSRCIANSAQAGAEQCAQDIDSLQALVGPFVFRRYHDFNAFNALRELHLKIRTEVDRNDVRREGSFDVKLGRGGIREIEFIAQLFQIVRGGRDPELRSRSTLATLATLARRKLISEEDSGNLTQAYEFLRRVEHALQYREDAQTHRLPLSPDSRATIAAMLRLDGPAFEQTLQRSTQQVQRVFDELLKSVNGQTAAGSTPVGSTPVGSTAGGSASAAPASAESTAVNAVDEAELDPDLRRRLSALRASPRFMSAKPETQQAVESLLGSALAKRTAPIGVTRLIDLIETVIGRPAYLTLLALFPKAFERVLDMLTKAKWAAEYLNRHPIVLDELLDGQLLEAVDYRQWRQTLETQLQQLSHNGQPDIERQMDLMREAHHAQEFRLLAQDLDGLLSVERLSDHLSELADQVLELSLQLIWSALPNHFRPAPRFAIIAYGKLGGKELGYASDLDLVFLYDDDDDRAAEAYSRLAQKLSGWLSLRTAAGILFEIDLRLRPNGNAGLLVTTVQGFEDYQRDSAWVWEHQALTRARFAAGDPAIGARFEAIRQTMIAREREPVELARQVREMRQKMLDGHPNRTALFDLKHDRGGMVDIEFIVQFLVLAFSARHSELRADAGNIALLNRAGRLGLIDPALADQVGGIYRKYRQLQHLLRLNGASYSRIEPDSVAAEKQAVLKLWAQIFER